MILLFERISFRCVDLYWIHKIKIIQKKAKKENSRLYVYVIIDKLLLEFNLSAYRDIALEMFNEMRGKIDPERNFQKNGMKSGVGNEKTF